MILEITGEQAVTEKEWQEACDRSPGATFFHTPLWAAIYSRYSSRFMKPCSRRIVFSDGKSVILCLVRRKILGLFESYVSSPAGNYGGWISSDNLGVDHIRLLVSRLSEFDNIIWRENPFQPGLKDTDIPDSTEEFTYAACLTGGFEAFYKKWSRGHTNAVNKARRLGVIVRKGNSIQDWKNHYKGYRKLRGRWARASNDYKWKLFRLLYESQSVNVVLWMAEKDGKLINSLVCFCYNGHVVLWHNGASPEDFSIRSIHLLVYEIAKESANSGQSWIDMNPSHGNPGVMDFKKHFGLEPYRCRLFVKKTGFLKAIYYLKRSFKPQNKSKK
jgi:hypothetical protein